MRTRAPLWALLAGCVLLGSGASVEGADGAAASRNNEGNRLYNDRRYDEALKMYTDAQARLPDAAELHYNIGNVLYRKRQFDKAEEEYRRAEGSPDRALAQAAVYNRGNALLMQGRFQEAAQAYIQALRARPDDAEAKRNLELALRMMQQEKKQKQQPQDGGEDDQKPPEPSPQDAEPSGPQDTKKPPPRPGQMSEEEARSLLEALREQEREGIKKHVSAGVPRRRDPEKDW